MRLFPLLFFMAGQTYPKNVVLHSIFPNTNKAKFYFSSSFRDIYAVRLTFSPQRLMHSVYLRKLLTNDLSPIITYISYTRSNFTREIQGVNMISARLHCTATCAQAIFSLEELCHGGVPRVHALANSGATIIRRARPGKSNIDYPTCCRPVQRA